jgi:hypothetical protein
MNRNREGLIMSKLPWTPWHEVVQLREELKKGELALQTFAADLYGVVMNQPKTPAVYRDPKEFFSLTYPTFNLRELAKDVVSRLAGQSDKAVRQLVLTYGGGKTHALITLYHLVKDPETLPDIPAVEEFKQHIGMTPPKTRVAVLAFDHLDPEQGMEIVAPNGLKARFRYPWSVLAFQLGGREGLNILGDASGPERETPPFVNVLEELLDLPQKEGLASLILIDEVLMWARTKIGTDPVWADRLQDFFQCLTQAVANTKNCGIVASLLSSDPKSSDTQGKGIIHDLSAVFRREQEEPVEPVVKEDVAEVLRRRFFTLESTRDQGIFRPHVMAALKGVFDLDLQTKQDKQGAEERFVKSYPFHPDLTDVFYSKWTAMESFQRTRGILRTFALALRDAVTWDMCPLVAANVFLEKPGTSGIAPAARELTTVAATEEYEGKRQEWTGILEGELAKAREIQADAGLKFREMEQAVFATFFHSQPIGQKALTRELMVLLGPTRPDKITLEKGLKQWAESSWFLDDEALQDADTGPDGQKLLPKSWQLGSKPNLTQMHSEAVKKVAADIIETRLLDEIYKLRSLRAVAEGAGVQFHNLPDRPKDIGDDGEFHFAILKPQAACTPDHPSPEAKKYLDETTGSDKPRVYRNAVILAVPSVDGLEAARNAISDHLGWKGVQIKLQGKQLEPSTWAKLVNHVSMSEKKIAGMIQQAYCIVVTVSEQNTITAFRLIPGDAPLFQLIKNDTRSRIQDSALNAEALLPGGPYDLWREGEESRWVKDLVGAFAQSPHLPKMLNRQAILQTLVQGCREGLFVLRLLRPDRSERTWWREKPDENALKDPALEVVLPEAASLAALPSGLLSPGAMPGLWNGDEISVQAVYDYFAGGHEITIQQDGYDEQVIIPKAEKSVVDAALTANIQDGKLWLISGPASIWQEDVPSGLLTDDAQLHGPPNRISLFDLLRDKLPGAWTNGETTALALCVGLSKAQDKALPWRVVRNAIDEALNSGMLELVMDSGPWPTDFPGAKAVKLRERAGKTIKPPPPPVQPNILIAEADLLTHEIQELADQIPEISKAAAGLNLRIGIKIQLGGPQRPADDLVERLNNLLQLVSDKLKLV